MSRSVDILLGEILIAIDLLRQYTAGMDDEAFRVNVEKQDAVFRRLEIIGEAVKGVPSDVRAAYPDVPWRDRDGGHVGEPGVCPDTFVAGSHQPASMVVSCPV